jgi:hypothetical protein
MSGLRKGGENRRGRRQEGGKERGEDARVRYLGGFALFLYPSSSFILIAQNLKEGIVIVVDFRMRKKIPEPASVSPALLLLLRLLPVLTLTLALLSSPAASSTSPWPTSTLSAPRPALTLTLTLLTLPPRPLPGLGTLTLCASRSNRQSSLASVLLLLPALDDDLLVTTTLGRDLDPTFSSVNRPQRGDDGPSCGLHRLVLDESASLGLYKVDLGDLAVLAERVTENGFGHGRGRLLRLPVVQLERVNEFAGTKSTNQPSRLMLSSCARLTLTKQMLVVTALAASS